MGRCRLYVIARRLVNRDQLSRMVIDDAKTAGERKRIALSVVVQRRLKRRVAAITGMTVIFQAV